LHRLAQQQRINPKETHSFFPRVVKTRSAVAAGGLVAAATRTTAEATEFAASHTAAAACQGAGPPQNTERHRGTAQDCGDPVSRSCAEGTGGESGSDSDRESVSGSERQFKWSAPPPLWKDRRSAALATAKVAGTAVAETCR